MLLRLGWAQQHIALGLQEIHRWRPGSWETVWSFVATWVTNNHEHRYGPWQQPKLDVLVVLLGLAGLIAQISMIKETASSPNSSMSPGPLNLRW